MLYYWLKQVHVYSVLLSFLLFAARGAWVLSGRDLPRRLVVRIVPIGVDTILLGSAVWLTTVIQQYPFRDAWLTAKVLLLTAYIVLGSLALRPGLDRGPRAVAFIAAMLTFLLLVTVAQLRHPQGFLLRVVS
jgi:uncharacterized membrane protein SirB2